MLKALIFDVDGTLADTERDGHRIAFNMAFNDAGLDWHWDENLYGELLAVTGGKERMTHFIKTHRPNEWSADMPNRIVALQAKKTQFYTQLLSEGKIPLRTGVARLLNEARAAGLRLAIATTTTPENVTALLTHTLGAESIQWFDVIAAGDIVPAKKPAPDIYHYALTEMGLHANECLAFEDSYNGIQSTNQAGIKTIVTVNGYTEADDFNGAMVVLSDLGEPAQAMTVLTGNLADPYVSVATLNKLHQNFVS
ncbi:MAG: HAD family hydrolase [Proteobacteria bacterium]|nr:HAD family hydrolase [Pseudomonadota bacterium]